MSKSSRNQAVRAKKEFSLSAPKLELEKLTFLLLLLLLPTQLGKHFWPSFSEVLGIRIDYLSPTVYVTDVLISMLFLFWLKRRGFKKILPVGLNQKMAWIAFLSYLLVNISVSMTPFLAMYGLVKILELLFFGAYISQTVKTLKELQEIADIFCITSAGESLLAIAQYINQGSINGMLYFLGERSFTADTPGIANASINHELLLRPYATFPHPNVLAGFLLCSLVLIYSYFNAEKSVIKKIIKTGVLSIGSIGLLLTLSRTTTILWLFLSISLLISKLKKFNSKSFSSLLILIVAAIVVFCILALTPVFPRFLGTTLAEESVTQRVQLIQNTTTLIVNHPFFGVGLYNFLPSLAKKQKITTATIYMQPVHNIFLLIVTEIGIIGLLFFLFFLLATYRKLLRKQNSAPKTLLIILSLILITGLFDHYWLTLQQGQLLAALAFGLSWAL